jgi:hypothetical protein
MGISRQCASQWVNRWRRYGEAGLADRPSVPHRQPTATTAEVVARIEQLRRPGVYGLTAQRKPRLPVELSAVLRVRAATRYRLQ